MYKVYKIQVDKHEYLDKITILSNNLYNVALYNVRQNYFKNKTHLNYFGNYPLCKENENYKLLPAQSAQAVIKQVDLAFKSFFQLNKDFKKHPSKYKGRPKITSYKKKGGKNIVTIPSQSIRIKDCCLLFPKTDYKVFLGKLEINNLVEVKIKPYNKYYEISICYEDKGQEKVTPNDNYIGIDLGVSNFATITNNIGLRPVIVKGGIIKSINQKYNKDRAKLMSFIGDRGDSNRIELITRKRNNRVDNFIHNSSKKIIDYCLDNDITNIVIGYNKGWKQESDIGKQNNQNFVSIPHYKFVFQLQYKAERYGIKVITNEESYTSKCDALSLEDMKHKETYFGKRVKRGLFRTRDNQKINADINGSLNILRKVIGNDYISLLDRGLVKNPVMLKNITKKINFCNSLQ